MSNISRFHEFGKKIIGIGRNYRLHAVELGNEVPTEPVIFLKPTTSYALNQVIKLPSNATELHHEVELGVVMGKTARNIQEKQAMEYVAGYALALDMTDREEQNRAKAKGLPWSLAKGFDTACPISHFIDKADIVDPHNVRLWLNVNGAKRQEGNTSDMIFRIPFLIQWLSERFTLERGDVILTGTPAGVGPVKHGDSIECGLDELVVMKCSVQK